MSKHKILRKKEVTVLSLRIKLSLALILMILGGLFFFKAAYFLSKNKPVRGEILVLDGQIADYAVQEAIRLFSDYNYQLIVTTGGNLPSGYFLSEYHSMAEMTYATFIALGFDSTKLVAIPGGEVTINRTYHSALTLKLWMDKNCISADSIDILTIGCHSRRSQMLFQKAVGDSCKVGVYSIPDKTFEPNKWWASSRGARTVISESIAYLYALVNL